MAEISYNSTKRSKHKSFLEVERNSHNEIMIMIQQELAEDTIVFLSRDSAIKLAKQLRREISFLQEVEVNNG